MPVINPMLIYLMDISDALKTIGMVVFMIAAFVIAIPFIVGAFEYLCSMPYGENDPDYKKSLKILAMAKKNLQSKAFIILIVSFISATFVPSKDTIYKMMVANMVTYENVNFASETIEDAFDHVIDKFNELKGE